MYFERNEASGCNDQLGCQGCPLWLQTAMAYKRVYELSKIH